MAHMSKIAIFSICKSDFGTCSKNWPLIFQTDTFGNGSKLEDIEIEIKNCFKL